jgi:hypothetical protein
MSCRSCCAVNSRARMRLGLLALAGWLGACSSPQVEQYAAEQPSFDLPRYFTGHTQAWGMFQGRGGEVARRFTVQIDGRALDGGLVLEEEFLYSDGTRQHRTWTLRPDGAGGWLGSAADVVGTAHGRGAGNAFHLQYVLRVPVDGSSWDMDMDDWMFLVDERTVVNRTRMSKLGIELGQVSLFFRRPE